MSRTYAGYIFECKVCGEKHLLDSGEPHNGILVPCANDPNAVREYKKTQFEFWHGSYWDVFNNLVQEVKG